jgi:hypothetical protein
MGLSLDNFIIWKEVKLAANFIKKNSLWQDQESKQPQWTTFELKKTEKQHTIIQPAAEPELAHHGHVPRLHRWPPLHAAMSSASPSRVVSCDTMFIHIVVQAERVHKRFGGLNWDRANGEWP